MSVKKLGNTGLYVYQAKGTEETVYCGLIDAEGNDVLRRNDRERSVLCDIRRRKNRYDVNVKFLNELNGDTILDLTLYAPDEKKALEMRERFLSKPSFIITRIMNMFL